MKRLLLVIALCVVTQGQTKPERAPITLSPEVSQQWTINSLQIQNLQQQQQILLLKAHVPEDYQLAGRDGQGQIVLIAPPSVAVKASPEKK